MIRVRDIAFFIVWPLTVSACDTAYLTAMEKMGYAKRDILTSRVKSARDAQEDAKKEIQSALEQFSKVVSYEGGDWEATYKKLNGELRATGRCIWISRFSTRCPSGSTPPAISPKPM